MFIYTVCWKSVFFKYWRIIFTLFFKRSVHPRNSKNKCFTLAMSHFVLLFQTLYIVGVDNLLERSAISKCIWKIWIRDHTKDSGSQEVWLLCSFNHEHLHTWSKTNVNKFTSLSQTVAKLGVQNLESYMRIIFEHELDILSNTKVSLAKIHGENFMNFRLLLVCHLLCNDLLLVLRTLKQAPLSN